MNSKLFNYFKNSPIRNKEYLVKSGDTLYKIAKKYGVTVGDIMDLNDLEGTLIYPNQVLVISKSVPSGAMYFMEYLVKENDTLASISEALDVPTNEIGKYNDVTKLVLAEGQTLKIPTRHKVYIVQENDTLDKILRKTNMTLEEFLEINIDNLLRPGTTIYVK